MSVLSNQLKLAKCGEDQRILDLENIGKAMANEDWPDQELRIIRNLKKNARYGESDEFRFGRSFRNSDIAHGYGEQLEDNLSEFMKTHDLSCKSGWHFFSREPDYEIALPWFVFGTYVSVSIIFNWFCDEED